MAKMTLELSLRSYVLKHHHIQRKLVLKPPQYPPLSFLLCDFPCKTLSPLHFLNFSWSYCWLFHLKCVKKGSFEQLLQRVVWLMLTANLKTTLEGKGWLYSKMFWVNYSTKAIYGPSLLVKLILPCLFSLSGSMLHLLLVEKWSPKQQLFWAPSVRTNMFFPLFGCLAHAGKLG